MPAQPSEREAYQHDIYKSHLNRRFFIPTPQNPKTQSRMASIRVVVPLFFRLPTYLRGFFFLLVFTLSYSESHCCASVL